MGLAGMAPYGSLRAACCKFTDMCTIRSKHKRMVNSLWISRCCMGLKHTNQSGEVCATEPKPQRDSVCLCCKSALVVPHCKYVNTRQAAIQFRKGKHCVHMLKLNASIITHHMLFRFHNMLAISQWGDTP